MVQGTGILTGGIDCPYLNAEIRARVASALPLGYRTPRIRNSGPGLIKAMVNCTRTRRSKRSSPPGQHLCPSAYRSAQKSCRFSYICSR
jgi:6-phosphofructokinase